MARARETGLSKFRARPHWTQTILGTPSVTLGLTTPPPKTGLGPQEPVCVGFATTIGKLEVGITG